MTRIKNAIIMALLLLTGSFTSRMAAQEADYKWSIGAGLGMSGYIGEYNGNNPFSHPGLAVTATGSYEYNVRWSFACMGTISTVSGNVSSLSGAYPEWMKEKFNSMTGELSFRAEFNFFPYGIGETYKSLKRWTPYLAAGVGFIMAKPKGSSFGIAPELPLAFGVKFKVNKRFNLLAELSFTKTFTDVIDGAKDIYGISSSWFKNTDWMSALTVGFRYEFGERCATCHYVD